MARTFVTGANGFIGSHLVEYLLDGGHHVTGLVRSTSDLSNLQAAFQKHGDRIRLVVGDLRSSTDLQSAVQDPEYVYHLGAVLMGTSEAEFQQTNVGGARNLLEVLAAGNSPSLKRFLFVSSQAAAGPSPSADPIDETAIPKPVSWYGGSKRDAESLVRQFGESGLPVTIVRPAGVYGEREQDLSNGTFPIVSLGLLPRVGLGRKVVSFVYVRELVRAIADAAESSSTRGQTYFLADPAPYDTREVISAIADAMGRRLRIPMVTPTFLLSIMAAGAELGRVFSRKRASLTRDKVKEVRQRFWACTPGAAARDFNWSSQIALGDGMKRAVADWRERRERVWSLRGEPAADVAKKAYLLSLLLGIALEGTANLAGWYQFNPWWIVLVVIFAVFGGVMGTISLLTARRSVVLQFLSGATVGIGAELLNVFWLHAWTFDPATFGRITDPWMRSIAVGLPAGLMPVLIAAALRALYSKRLRLG